MYSTAWKLAFIAMDGSFTIAALTFEARTWHCHFWNVSMFAFEPQHLLYLTASGKKNLKQDTELHPFLYDF